MTHDVQLDEQLWRELRVLFEWHEGFTLVLLYVEDARPLQGVWQRLNDVARLRSRTAQRISPETAAELLESVLGVLLDGDSKAPSRRGPLWIDLERHPGDGNWNAARDALLARLNERRSALERANPRLIVLNLPADYVNRVPALAPDRWSVRNFSRQIQARPTIERSVEAVFEPRTSDRPLGQETPQEARLYREWRRLRRSVTPKRSIP
jgi:hypothetical protein